MMYAGVVFKSLHGVFYSVSLCVVACSVFHVRCNLSRHVVCSNSSNNF